MYVERYRRLRDLREDHDLTQAQVGDAINITQRAYSYYESGQHIIPPEVLLRLADTVLGVTFALVFAAVFHRLAGRCLPGAEQQTA